MLVAYLDESGVHEGDTLAVGGWVSSEAHWLEFEARWRAVLDKYASIRPTEVLHKRTGKASPFEFKAADCENLKGFFARWTPDIRDEFKNELTTIISSLPLAGEGYATERISHKSYSGMIAWVHKEMGGAYAVVVAGCVMGIARSAGMFLLEDEKIAFFLDDQKEFGEKAHSIYKILKNPSDAAVPRPPQLSRLGTFTFANSAECLPLQAADLLAYETYKHSQAQLRMILQKSKQAQRPRITWQRLQATERVNFTQWDYKIGWPDGVDPTGGVLPPRLPQKERKSRSPKG
jgi:hypothetical protein